MAASRRCGAGLITIESWRKKGDEQETSQEVEFSCDREAGHGGWHRDVDKFWKVY